MKSITHPYNTLQYYMTGPAGSKGNKLDIKKTEIKMISVFVFIKFKFMINDVILSFELSHGNE